MGGKKTVTTTDNKSEVQLPAWMTAAGEGLYNEAAATAKANPIQAYTGRMSTPTSTNQAAASHLARQGQGAWAPSMNAASEATARSMAGGAPQMTAAMSAGAPTVSTEMWNGDAAGRYMDPYLGKVQGNTLNLMREQAAMDRNDLGDQMGAAKAYGGARAALMQSEQARNQERNRTDYVDRSTSDAYNNAASMFSNDMGRKLSADTTNAGFLDAMASRNQSAENAARGMNATMQNSFLDRLMAGGAQQANIGKGISDLNTRDIGNMSTTGAVDQQTAQDDLDRQYSEFLRMQDAPMDRYRDLMGILSGSPRNVTTTENGKTVQKTSTGLGGSLMGLGQLGLSAYSSGMFSDRRLKRDVMFIERAPSGLGIYRYRYMWEAPEAPPHIGVMADEVERIAPEALGPAVFGYQTVDYSKLGGLI